MGSDGHVEDQDAEGYNLINGFPSSVSLVCNYPIFASSHFSTHYTHGGSQRSSKILPLHPLHSLASSRNPQGQMRTGLNGSIHGMHYVESPSTNLKGLKATYTKSRLPSQTLHVSNNIAILLLFGTASWSTRRALKGRHPAFLLSKW
ncbi:hypothetical protein M407DRAFT_33272 [Tulasnella calospora MUT 4182]|uniref:Uncharacterized protein n=1 Tax=Tulasnella calospora MUT 4182 TaxID=1051891 RepID=A0A0C3L695_9AGAM|nr:hypothetical protein M407DRAFT_33272 [Tulasnella calospora MUT 4182]